MDPVASFYSAPQIGSGIPIYAGSRRQLGSGLWGTLQRIARPILAKFVPRIGKTVATRAINVLAGAASDALNQRSSFLDSLKTRGKLEAQKALNAIAKQQRGGRRGKKRRASRKPSKNRKASKRAAHLPW